MKTLLHGDALVAFNQGVEASGKKGYDFQLCPYSGEETLLLELAWMYGFWQSKHYNFQLDVSEYVRKYV